MSVGGVLKARSLESLAQELIPQLAGAQNASCPEVQAHAALGEVREVEGVVAPEGAVVVPEVVVWVVRKDADRCSGCLCHGVSPFGFRTRKPDQ